MFAAVLPLFSSPIVEEAEWESRGKKGELGRRCNGRERKEERKVREKGYECILLLRRRYHTSISRLSPRRLCCRCICFSFSCVLQYHIDATVYHIDETVYHCFIVIPFPIVHSLISQRVGFRSLVSTSLSFSFSRFLLGTIRL